ncbi:MAG: lipid-A-disaccharide synthase [Nitrospirae bacterium]|nr:lipid-A-disaccharide synthase [Nitrospirota bacterium]
MKTVMIVAGESSGELYGSLLAKALKALWPDVRLVGIGGERMKEAGVELLSGISSSLGLTEVLQSFSRVRESFRKTVAALTEVAPAVVVLIDYPDFNFKVARLAKRRGIKVLYYVSPQVWAWRRGRVRTMGEITDKIAVILPFEEEIYRKAGIPCEFVGHPIMEEIEAYEAENPERGPASEVQGPGETRKSGPTIALLPGSRPNELKSLLPVFVDFVGRAKEEFGPCRCVMPLAPNVETEKFTGALGALGKLGVECTRGGATAVLASSDMAVVASGTATLQAALLGVPMVVVYKVSPLTYSIGKRVLNVKHISLVNIVAGEEVVPELIQRRADAESIMKQCRKILYDESCRASMSSSFRKIRRLFSGKHPSRSVAGIIGGMAGWAPRGTGDLPGES